ncbi:M18 family aminopeptidase [Borrelia anserina]|uniref:M18 family aminopeptidase n=2 Tax=Borrelia anserina TaxID=143 RepID=W5SNV3_BORAN|nr:M18 family aminopeptidase [Borrelia anserina]AHH08597.1 Aspartyl aminopeptidase [Borrelia anserina BA2]APR65060.1 aminopeptidase [Borrelia anserina Es]UPA06987.1 M18 family aminopeptidase [Borrelia anserina]
MNDHTLDISHFQNLLDKSLTPYHLVNYIEQKLMYYLNAKELKLEDKWTLETGYYYVKKEGTSLIAFNINTNKIHEPFLIAAAHSDSPSLKLKIESTEHKGNVFAHHIEVYGSPIISTWTDRDLSLAGVVYFNQKDGTTNSELITIENIGIIPNVAIHLNRKANEGFAYDAHENIMIITSFKKSIKEKILKKLQISEKDFLSCDLIFTASEPSKIIGSESEFLASKNLDNKSGCHAIINAFVNTNNNKNKVAIFFDNEEIGSVTSRGANSKLLTEILERIDHVLNLEKEEHIIKLNRSFIISMDGAHGVHPGYLCKHDPNYQISLGKGVTIKSNANFKYATTANGCAKLKALAMKNNIKIQEIMLKANINAGSTIGPIVNSQTGIETIDIGIPMWGMHSLRETIAISDHIEAIKLLRTFFENWN